MITYFPKQIAYRACFIFIAAFSLVSLFFFDYAISMKFTVASIIWVLGFFSLSHFTSKEWRKVDDKSFYTYLFITALGLRLVWVVASYFYYTAETGIPFEYAAADSLYYHDLASELARIKWEEAMVFFIGQASTNISDLGYPLYLTLLYKLVGNSIIITRIIKAIIGAYTCLLIYRLCVRTFGEETARMASIMAAFMPNLIIYCGYHLKEIEMLFLAVAFMERLDYLIRNKKIFAWDALIPTFIALSLFLFRTVLGAAAIFTFATTVLVSTEATMKKNGRRVALITWGILSLLVLRGGAIMTETEALWEERDTSVDRKRTEQTLRGNQWARYATGPVMAPMAVVLPFSTLVNIDDQYGQQEKAGGNYIRNFMGFFALLAIYEAIRRKKWRDFAIIGSFVFSYLGVISVTGFSNSERFLLPGLPCLIMMWAYGISTLRMKTYRLLNPWCFIVIAMEIGWAYFKLGSRGLF